MCGRYTQKLKADDLVAAMGARDDTGGGVVENHNVAPTSTMPIVVAEAAASSADDGREVGAEAAAPASRVLRLATWGLVPSWAKDPSVGSRMINARSETAATKPAFRSAFATRRCLVPATGFYEWFRPGGGTRRGQPFYVHPGSHPGVSGIFAFAGLYEIWRRGESPLVTFTILTTGAAGGLEFLHDRSPVIVPSSAWDRWLDPATRNAAPLAPLLRPVPAGVVMAHPVAAEVGNVRNKGPHLTDPVELDPAVKEALADATESAVRLAPAVRPDFAGMSARPARPPGTVDLALFGDESVGDLECASEEGAAAGRGAT